MTDSHEAAARATLDFLLNQTAALVGFASALRVTGQENLERLGELLAHRATIWADEANALSRRLDALK